MYKNLLMALAAFIIVACATKKTSVTNKITPTEEKASVENIASKDSLPAEIAQGKLLYTQNCGSCHGLKKPESEPESEWRRIVPKMVKKVNASSQKLSPEDEQLILDYVITMITKK